MQGLAITDHGPALASTTPSPFFDRLHDPVPGVRLLKGMECNIVDEHGTIDFPSRYLEYSDVVLLGIHPNCAGGQSSDYYTALLAAALRRNPFVDIVTHVNDPSFPVDFEAVATVAKELGMAMELNNSKTALARTPPEVTGAMLTAFRKVGCRVALCSDAHAINEVGCDEAVRPLLSHFGIGEELVVNATGSSAFVFVEERRSVKLQCMH